MGGEGRGGEWRGCLRTTESIQTTLESSNHRLRLTSERRDHVRQKALDQRGLLVERQVDARLIHQLAEEHDAIALALTPLAAELGILLRPRALSLLHHPLRPLPSLVLLVRPYSYSLAAKERGWPRTRCFSLCLLPSSMRR